MQTPGPLKSAAWAAAGAALLGSGMFLGFLAALIRRNKDNGRPVPEPGPVGGPPPDQTYLKRIDELTQAVADIQMRFESATPSLPQELGAVNARVEELERRIQQLVSEVPAVPPVDQVLAAVEHMVAVKISGLDERLTDQVHAIELLRTASAQTDALLQKLINAVEALADQTAEKVKVAEPELASVAPRDYPIA